MGLIFWLPTYCLGDMPIFFQRGVLARYVWVPGGHRIWNFRTVLILVILGDWELLWPWTDLNWSFALGGDMKSSFCRIARKFMPRFSVQISTRLFMKLFQIWVWPIGFTGSYVVVIVFKRHAGMPVAVNPQVPGNSALINCKREPSVHHSPNINTTDLKQLSKICTQILN